ncbi:unnamed protein product [Paramecium primaurelia]|uniref:Uncharacterized protein n=1 Tax=Paramecium primaurelia TaxID=5886 RepID=A0A8S1ME17_PARPR|nr:unnamed protein product [Paramecium primaurelia]
MVEKLIDIMHHNFNRPKVLDITIIKEQHNYFGLHITKKMNYFKNSVIINHNSLNQHNHLMQSITFAHKDSMIPRNTLQRKNREQMKIYLKLQIRLLIFNVRTKYQRIYGKVSYQNYLLTVIKSKHLMPNIKLKSNLVPNSKLHNNPLKNNIKSANSEKVLSIIISNYPRSNQKLI